MNAAPVIELETPPGDDVRQLLTEHLADMHATSPAGSVHALEPSALTRPSLSFWTARQAGELLGCGALQELGAAEGEIKSMRTGAAARRRGVAGALLSRLVAAAVERGYIRLYLETGSHDYFAPARRLYLRHGFTECAPFGPYRPDPNSVFMTLDLAAPGADRGTAF
ncbi:GNAT family N-acetyltransferase [Paenarthrobacter sp. DKR-5]|uniref:GNAT family N-acetyltransferase n=1 Tax=Paenarthrobacter sp. DKR-5 TaxID=2835535 RepID=UPI0027DC9047|nr:GNAT family N-acetyltransferase [Paenarthrobacter sp. DKR-5]